METLAILLYNKTTELLMKCVGVIALFLLPIKPLMVAIGGFVFIDLLTGLYKAKKKGEELTSRRIRDTISKLISYQIAIIMCFVLEKIFMPEAPAVKIISSLIAMTELISVNENLFAITGLDIFKTIIEKLSIFKSKQEINKKDE